MIRSELGHVRVDDVDLTVVVEDVTIQQHTCACVGCRPELHVTGPRRSEAHAGVRFGDRGPEWVVTFGGELVTKAFECMAGDPGWVLRYAADPDTGQLHLCRSCGRREPCVERLEGDVQVSRQPSNVAKYGATA